MRAIDQHDKRMFGNEQARHRDAARRLAAHIAEASGYLTRDIGGDDKQMSAFAAGHARTIRNDVLELLERLTALESLRQVAFLVEDDAQ